ncbi:ATP-grasp domain-containing protein [Shewanella fidelis]|uniref:ATP-grasp domain-containing protein n=1 Tax=Shewanella fidelis TaxID=173509 RepID=UPI00048F4F90|nr:hypothetical protein [Shewanella fidelis]
MKLGVLTSFDKDHVNFVSACKELNIEFELVDFLAPDWLRKVKESKCDGFLARPSCDMQERKSCFDERLFILNKVMKKPIYPSFDELYIYENKRNMYYWLEANDYPHAKTLVFLRRDEALAYADSCQYPLIGKSNIGAGSSGVIKINKASELKSYINRIFGKLDGKICFGRSPTSNKVKIPLPVIGKAQKHYVILQECIDVKWEWRIIKIDNSFFGYRKLLGENGFASGNNLDGWGKPPKELLLMVKSICEKGDFKSMAVDILESNSGEFFVNELQSHFGSYNPSQMYIDDKPCRFTWSDSKNDFELEEGYFCQNGCANLRVSHFLKLLG